MDRQRQDPCGLAFGHREVTHFMAKANCCLLQMDRDGVVDRRSDAGFGQGGLQFITAINLDGIVRPPNKIYIAAGDAITLTGNSEGTTGIVQCTAVIRR